MKCPTKGKLLQFADRKISENESRIISAHLDGCSECRDTVRKHQVDLSLIREKMKRLDPASIPTRPFAPSKAGPVRARRRSAFPMIWRSYIQVPATAIIVMGIVFVGLVSGLIAQGVRLARLESRPAARAQAETILISATTSFQAYGLDIDLKNYRPIEHPNIIVLQEETR